MATIVIKDLPENVALDREAMQAITGGARLRGTTPMRRVSRGDRIAAPAGALRETRPKASACRPAPSMLFK